MLTELRTFIAVVRHGSFARAGAHIGLTQGAVSGHIQRLEQHIGVQLFDRTGRKAVLTDMGRDVHARALEIVDAITHLGDSAPAGDTRGTLVIGAITSAQQSWLMDALAGFRQEFPGMAVRVVPGASLSILGQVDTGELDMAVMIRAPYVLPPEVHWHTLMREPFLVLVPADHEGDNWRDALTQYPFIRYDRSSFGGRAIDLFLRKQQLVLNEALELDEVVALARAVGNGMGATMVPAASACLPFPENVRALPMGSDAVFREIGIAARSQRSHPGVADRLIMLMQESALADQARAFDYLGKHGIYPGAASCDPGRAPSLT